MILICQNCLNKISMEVENSILTSSTEESDYNFGISLIDFLENESVRVAFICPTCSAIHFTNSKGICTDVYIRMLKKEERLSNNNAKVNHPEYYGGEDDTYEAIKVIDAWKLDFCLGNTIKYISRCKKKENAILDLKKALWYLQHEIEVIEKELK